MADYPVPGTRAEQILEHIRAHPGVTRSSIIRTLGLNPAIVRYCLDMLMAKELIVDEQDGRGHHHYEARVREASR